jgi:hypothetical protein
LLPPHDEDENRSLDRLNIEILRFLNVCAVRRPDLIEKYHVMKLQFGGLLDRLWEMDTGKRLKLDPERSRLLLARVSEDNKRFAERYLSPDHASLLLALPSNSALCPPPLDKQALFDRMMVLFDSSTLANLAVDYAT